MDEREQMLEEMRADYAKIQAGLNEMYDNEPDKREMVDLLVSLCNIVSLAVTKGDREAFDAVFLKMPSERKKEAATA